MRGDLMKLNLAALRDLYQSGQATPADVVDAVYDRIAAGPLAPVWISLVPRATAVEQARRLDNPALPLYGVPFAIKDNIDLAGLPTTAGCPAYAYEPTHSAPEI